MKDDVVSYELAEKYRDLINHAIPFSGMIKGKNGYNIHTYRRSDIQTWLRTEYGLDVIVSPIKTGDGKRYTVDLYNIDGEMDSLTNIDKTYKQAFEKGLESALKYIK